MDTETQAILKIVVRNLLLSSWQQLMSDAQMQILAETEVLLKSNRVDGHHKADLIERLEALMPHVEQRYQAPINALVRDMNRLVAESGRSPEKLSKARLDTRSLSQGYVNQAIPFEQAS